MEVNRSFGQHHVTVNQMSRSQPLGSEQRVTRCSVAVMEMEPPQTQGFLEGSELAGFGLPTSAHRHLDIWQSSGELTSPIAGQPGPSGVHLVWQINKEMERLVGALRPPVQVAGLSMLAQGLGFIVAY